jgi:probable HAF family extracellular repeat protein
MHIPCGPVSSRAGAGGCGRFAGVAILSILALTVASTSLAHAQSFQPLYLVGSTGDSVLGISRDGNAVVGQRLSVCLISKFQPAVFCNFGFRWVHGHEDVVGVPLPGAQSFASGANRDGSVFVGAVGVPAFLGSLFPLQAFRSAPGRPGNSNLGFLPGAQESAASAVNADGTVVVGSSPPLGASSISPQAFRWVEDNSGSPSGGTMTALGVLPGATTSQANGVNGDGTIVVGRSGTAAFRWVKDNSGSPSGGTMTSLGFLPGSTSSGANGVNSDGSVVVGFSGQQAFRWTSGTMIGLGMLPGAADSNATGVSDDGAVVVGTSGGQAFRWTPAEGMRSIFDLLTAAGANLAGWNLFSATGVSADGTVMVGTGSFNDRIQGWIADMTPGCPMSSQLGDFNADGRSDLLFRRDSDGLLSQYLMNGFQLIAAQVLGTVGTEWKLVAAADFNGDGTADLLFRRKSDGMLSLYLMSGSQILSAQLIGAIGLDWDLVGAADFNSDSRADLLLRRATDGMLSLYLMNGFQVVSAQLIGAVGLDWRVRAVRDFNADGRADILFRRAGDGALSLYLFSAFQVLDARFLGIVAGNEWDLLGARDFSGDGTADLLFRRGDGMLSLYLMSGFQILNARLLGVVGFEWTLLGLGDLNGDGRSDMVFRRAGDGMLSAYLMNGFQLLAAELLGPIGVDWSACYGQPPLAHASR